MAAKNKIEWQAARYDRLADPHERWAAQILDRLAPASGECVLDAGCGSGRITRLLCERLDSAGPEWSVLAVDASRSMIDQARVALADFGDAVEFELSDLLDFELSSRPGIRRKRPPVDGVFSCAVFHWILDHQLLFERVYSWLKPGGRLVAQCGGLGNVEEWQRAIDEAVVQPEFSESFNGWEGPWHFAGTEETAERLERAGFEAVNCRLEEKVVKVEDARSYLEVVGLAAHLERLPEGHRDAFIDAVLRRVADPNTLRYIRLNMEAYRPSAAADPARLEV